MQIKIYTISFQFPRWLKKSLIFAGIPAIVLGIGAAVWATVAVDTSAIQNGSPISASTIKTNFDNLKAAVDILQTTVSTGTVANATNATTASKLSCTGCVGATQLAAGSITLGAVTSRQGTGVTGASGISGVYYYVGGTCLANEILISGSCWTPETNDMLSAALLTSTVDGANKRWVCYYHTTAATAPNAYGISNCLKATWP